LTQQTGFVLYDIHIVKLIVKAVHVMQSKPQLPPVNHPRTRHLPCSAPCNVGCDPYLRAGLIKISLTSDIHAVARDLPDMARKRLPFAFATAINETVKGMQEKVTKRLGRLTPNIKRAYGIRRAATLPARRPRFTEFLGSFRRVCAWDYSRPVS